MDPVLCLSIFAPQHVHCQHPHKHTQSASHEVYEPIPQPARPVNCIVRALSIGSHPHVHSTVIQTSFCDPIIPPINAYGTFKNSLGRCPVSPPFATQLPENSGSSSPVPEQPLLPGSISVTQRAQYGTVSGDLMPFGGGFTLCISSLRRVYRFVFRFSRTENTDIEGGAGRWEHRKHRPRVAGGGENIPLEVIARLSIWTGTLEVRGLEGESDSESESEPCHSH